MPGRVVFNDRSPNPRTRRVWTIVETSRQAYDGATAMDPEAVDVEAPQEWRKRHNHDCAKTNEVTHGIIVKNADLEALALGLQVLGLILREQLRR